mgnify:CR=1 FL=1
MIKNEYLAEFNSNSGITTESLISLKLPKRLPTDYIEFLKKFNGGEGFVGEEYLVLEKAEKLLERNKNYKIEEFDKNIFLIGGNGAGEGVAIDFRNDKPRYILIPLIFEYDAILYLGKNIKELFEQIYENGFFEEN